MRGFVISILVIVVGFALLPISPVSGAPCPDVLREPKCVRPDPLGAAGLSDTVDVQPSGGAESSLVAISGTGTAHAPIAISVGGDAEAHPRQEPRPTGTFRGDTSPAVAAGWRAESEDGHAVGGRAGSRDGHAVGGRAESHDGLAVAIHDAESRDSHVIAIGDARSDRGAAVSVLGRASGGRGQPEVDCRLAPGQAACPVADRVADTLQEPIGF